MSRVCPICGDEIPADSHRNKKLCGRKDCMLEQQRLSGRKSYHKLLGHTEPEKKSCIVCGDDISNLRTSRVVCLKPECKETIVKRAKSEWYERNHSTTTYKERVATNQANMRARRPHKERNRANVARDIQARPKRMESKVSDIPTPKRPTVNKNYQRKPSEASKIQLPKKRIEPSRISDNGDPWIPKAFNLPEQTPQHQSADKKETSQSLFEDPWNCQACRGEGCLCKLHQSMADDGTKPSPRLRQFQEGGILWNH